MTDWLPMPVLRELSAAGLAGEALVAACARVAADLAPLLTGLARPMSGADRMRLMRARRAAAADVLGGDGDVRMSASVVTKRDEIVTSNADISATAAALPDAQAGVEKAADTRLILARKALTVAGLSGNAVAVGAALLEQFNRSGRTFGYGLKRLGELTNRSERHVRRGVGELKAAGLFHVILHGGMAHTNRYEPQFGRMRELVEAYEAGRVRTARDAEPDKPDRSVRQTQSKNISTPRARVPDRRQGWLPLPIPGGAGAVTVAVHPAEAATEAAKRRVSLAFIAHTARFGPREAERMRATVDPERWQDAVTAEMRRRGDGIGVLLDAFAPAARAAG